MSARLVVTWPSFPGSAGSALLDEAGLQAAYAPRTGERTPADVARVVGDAVAVIASTDPFDASVFAACPDLRVVARVGVGFDAIDVDAATAAGVAVTITPGANTASVADHAVGLILAVLRRIAEHDAAVRRGEWRREAGDMPTELAGRTVGLVGYGAIGRLVGRRLAGFDVELLAHDPAYDGGGEAAAVTLPELFRRASVVSLHAPSLPSTHHLVGRAELALMGPDAILVNTSRGGLVDEDALVAALRAGGIRGAGLDVFAAEPPPIEHLRDLPNVVLTPHVAGFSDRSRDAMTRMASEAVLDVLAGRSPRGLVNPAALENARSQR